MKEQAVNQGNWSNGIELKWTRGGESSGFTGKGDPEADFWKLVKRGRIKWMCPVCLKNINKGLCKCKKSEERLEKSSSKSIPAV